VRPVIARPRKKPVATTPTETTPDVRADVRVPEPEPATQQVPEPVSDAPLADTPQKVPPPYQVPRPKAPPKQKPAANADDDDWSSFWKEAP
jgi:hypothetical protein